MMIGQATGSAAANPVAGEAKKGQRLFCEHCGAEIEILSPTTAQPPEQVLRCCGADMTASVGKDINLGVE